MTNEEQRTLAKAMLTMQEVQAQLAYLTAEVKALRRVADLARQLVAHDPAGGTYREYNSAESMRATMIEALRAVQEARDTGRAA